MVVLTRRVVTRYCSFRSAEWHLRMFAPRLPCPSAQILPCSVPSGSQRGFVLQIDTTLSACQRNRRIDRPTPEQLKR